MFKTIKRIMNWCGNFKGKIYLGFVFSFFSYIFAAAPVAVTAIAISDLFMSKKAGTPFNTKLILYSVLFILLFIILRFLFDYLRARFQESISYELIARDRLAIGESLKRVSLGYFQSVSTGNILSSITTGLNMLENMGIIMLNVFIGGYLNFIAIFLGLLFISPVSSLIALVAAALSFCFLLMISRISTKHAPLEAENNKELIGATIEYARGLPVVKSFCKGGTGTASIEKAIENSRKIHINGELGFIPGNCLHQLSLKCGSIGLIIAAIAGMFSQNLSLASSLMIIFFSLTIFNSLEPISDSTHVLAVINDALDQIDALKQDNFIDENGKNIKLDNFNIEFKNVDFGYDSRQILNNVSFTLPEKTSTAIVGPSGSGKTTIINLLARFYDVQAGSISVGGHNLKEFTCDSLLSNISMVFQNVYLFNDTVRANIAFGKPDTTEEEIINAAKKACCHDFIMALPDGYDTVIGEGGGTLSGGEKQRISIARAMLKDAPIIILDEATASIDPENEHLIQHAISELTVGKTIITIAHRLATIENADKILVVDEGQIVQQGNHNQLIKEEGIYKRFIATREKAEQWTVQ